MRAVVFTLCLGLILILPQGLGWHEEHPAAWALSREGDGWSSAVLSGASGNVTFEWYAAGATPNVQRLDVRDATGVLTVSAEMLSREWQGVGVEARIADVSVERGVTRAYGMGLVFHSIPECDAWASLFGGPDGTGGSIEMDAACFGPQPWSILTFAAGEDVERREIKLHATAPVVGDEVAHGEGSVFLPLANAQGTQYAQARSIGISQGAAVGEVDLPVAGRFVGSYAAFARTLGSSYENENTAGGCPCVFHGEDASASWNFRTSGLTKDIGDLVVAGVVLPAT